MKQTEPAEPGDPATFENPVPDASRENPQLVRPRGPWDALRANKLKYGKDFTKYLFVGILYTFINIFLMWLFIDVLRTGTVLGSVLAVSIIFITKYFAYIWVGFMVKGFLKYSLVTGLMSIVNVALMWLFVDILKIPTVLSSTIIVYSMFIVRFVSFYAVGLVRNG